MVQSCVEPPSQKMMGVRVPNKRQDSIWHNKYADYSTEKFTYRNTCMFLMLCQNQSKIANSKRHKVQNLQVKRC